MPRGIKKNANDIKIAELLRRKGSTVLNIMKSGKAEAIGKAFCNCQI